jgi:hypothetical protein
MQKARTAAAAAAGDCFPALVPNWPLSLSPAPRLARLLHRARISLYVQFRKYVLKDKYKWTVYIRWVQ